MSIEIYVKKSVVIPSTAFVLAVVHLYWYVSVERSFFEGITDRGVGLSSYLLVGLSLLYLSIALANYFRRNKSLIFSSKGIRDGLSSREIGFVGWGDIDRIEVSQSVVNGRVLIFYTPGSVYSRMVLKKSDHRRGPLATNLPLEIRGLSISRRVYQRIDVLWRNRIRSEL